MLLVRLGCEVSCYNWLLWHGNVKITNRGEWCMGVLRERKRAIVIISYHQLASHRFMSVCSNRIEEDVNLSLNFV